MKWWTFDLLTGRKLKPLPVLTGGRYQRDINMAGSLSCTVSLTPQTRDLNLYEATRPARTGLACIDGERVLQAGPIWTRRGTSKTLTLTGAGWWSYFDHRIVARQMLEDAIIHGVIDPLDPEWVLALTGSFSNIAKQLAAEAMEWTGGNLPIILPDDVAGAHEKTYNASDARTVGQRLREITALDGGPEIRFDSRLTEDRQGIQGIMRVGTDENPELASPKQLLLNAGAARSPITDLEMFEDGTGMASQGWGLGGRQSDQVVMTKVVNSWLLDHGYPLLELADNEHSNADNPDTLARWTGEALGRAQTTSEEWSFRLRRDKPLVGTYFEGDHALIKVANHGLIPDGKYQHKIVSLTGTSGSDFVKVQVRRRGV